MELCRVFAENARGTNVVVNQLEHGPGDIARFLRATREIAKTAPSRYQENLGGYLDFCK